MKMNVKQVIAAAMVFSGVVFGGIGGRSALADQVQSVTSVWGGDCTSGNVSCTSGRSISCSANANGNTAYYTFCSQQTGSYGSVNCIVYASNGGIYSQSSDTCP